MDADVGKWIRKRHITSEMLRTAAEEVSAGLYDALLARFLFKKRVARRQGGKSGGYRLIMAYHGTRAVFLFGFAKNEADTLSKEGLDLYRGLADTYITARNEEIERLVRVQALVEVANGETGGPDTSGAESRH